MLSETNQRLHIRTVSYVADRLDRQSSGKVGLIAPLHTDRPGLIAAIAYMLLDRLPANRRCLVLTEKGPILLRIADNLTGEDVKVYTFRQDARAESGYILAVLDEFAREMDRIMTLNIGAVVVFASRAARLRQILPAYSSLCTLAPEVSVVSIFENTTGAAEFIPQAGYSVDIHTL